MRIPQLRMEATYAKLAISTVPAKLDITQPPAEMTIEQPSAEMSVASIPARLTIDQSQAWASMNNKHVFQLIKDAADRGRQAVLDYIDRTAVQGDELMRIENGGDPLADQAAANSEGPPLEFNIALVPPPFSVKVDYEPGQLDIDWHIQKPRIDVNTHAPIIRYQQGAIKIDLAQRPSLHIDVVI
ncbi:DUF6470 family protein [Geobacillus sp. TFV-3]|uniref:DUF6470 family protein n=1 Tax=Geobacillus sp. TFV-3 TaxID=1897059 RepID=UPI00135B543C|nr:DUF6470 family protein [Geobacillus sp. TFV-3]KAF0996467.1 hypothetical protein BJQ97_03157 [Geobacillus sp. TFV-3]